MTLPEVLLWQLLRQRPNGIKFRRQHAIEPYVVDFFCREASLVIEIDGSMHEVGDRPHRDKARDARLHAHGLSILRIAAADVLEDPAGVTAYIVARASNPLHQPAAGPPPRSGEDQE